MAQYGPPTPISLTTPWGTITFNAASGDTYNLDPSVCSGFDQAPIRTTIEDSPMTDGGLVYDAWRGARIITLGGYLSITSSSTESGYLSARNTAENNLISALNSILRANGTLSQTPTGGSARTLTVRCDEPVNYTGGWVKNFIFGLVAANPDWT